MAGVVPANQPTRARPHGVLGAIADLCWCADRDVALAISRRRLPAMLTIVTVDSTTVLHCRRDMSSYGTLHGPANFLPLDMAAEAAAEATARLPRDDAGRPFMPPPTVPASGGGNESEAGEGAGAQADAGEGIGSIGRNVAGAQFAALADGNRYRLRVWPALVSQKSGG